MCKYFWKLDIKGILSVKFQVCGTFGLIGLIGDKKLGDSSYPLLPPPMNLKNMKKPLKKWRIGLMLSCQIRNCGHEWESNRWHPDSPTH